MRIGLVEDRVDLVFEDGDVGRDRIVNGFGRNWAQHLWFARVLGSFRWDHVGKNRSRRSMRQHARGELQCEEASETKAMEASDRMQGRQSRRWMERKESE